MMIRRKIGEKGQVVIPVDVRKFLRLRNGEDVVFEVVGNEVKMRKENDLHVLEEMFDLAKDSRREITLEDLRKIEDESYDLP